MVSMPVSSYLMHLVCMLIAGGLRKPSPDLQNRRGPALGDAAQEEVQGHKDGCKPQPYTGSLECPV
jgi:hypothetical protein